LFLSPERSGQICSEEKNSDREIHEFENKLDLLFIL
jgi:hypothetical protein